MEGQRVQALVWMHGKHTMSKTAVKTVAANKLQSLALAYRQSRDYCKRNLCKRGSYSHRTSKLAKAKSLSLGGSPQAVGRAP